MQVLAIEATRGGERLRVVVTDSAGAFATAAETDPIADVRSRLHSLYGMAATLSFVGTQAIVDLPFELDG